jgi:hypothetical protein
MTLNRRHALVGAGAALLALPATLLAAAKKIRVLDVNLRDVDSPMHVHGLPEGLMDIVAEGDSAGTASSVMEVSVPAHGTIVLRFEPKGLLRGLWEIRKPGTYVSNKTPWPPGAPYDPLVLGCVAYLEDAFIAPAGLTHVAYAYRHPIDNPGTILHGVQQSPMFLLVDSGDAPVGPLVVDLVEYDVTPTSQKSLEALPNTPRPPVKALLATWTIPAGTGRREIFVPPVIIPWNAKFIGIVCRTPRAQTVQLKLRSRLGPLVIDNEIPEEPPPEVQPDETGTCPDGYVFDIATQTCRYDPQAPPFIHYWYCLIEPAHGEHRGPYALSCPSTRNPDAHWHALYGQAGQYFILFNIAYKFHPPYGGIATTPPSCAASTGGPARKEVTQ